MSWCIASLFRQATRLLRPCIAGFNCAEAVNFGPPDWLPYGTDRAQKYRGDMKPLTLSHDALLVRNSLYHEAQA